MNKSNNFRRGRACVFLMHVHLVFVTKCRRKVFSKQILQDLKDIFTNVCNNFETQLIEFEGEKDHVHLLINYPSKVAISKLVNSLKGVSSRFIRLRKYACIQQSFWENHLWSPSYFAGSCGGASLEVIKQYIEQQQSPDL